MQPSCPRSVAAAEFAAELIPLTASHPHRDQQCAAYGQLHRARTFQCMHNLHESMQAYLAATRTCCMCAMSGVYGCIMCTGWQLAQRRMLPMIFHHYTSSPILAALRVAATANPLNPAPTAPVQPALSAFSPPSRRHTNLLMFHCCPIMQRPHVADQAQLENGSGTERCMAWMWSTVRQAAPSASTWCFLHTTQMRCCFICTAHSVPIMLTQVPPNGSTPIGSAPTDTHKTPLMHCHNSSRQCTAQSPMPGSQSIARLTNQYNQVVRQLCLAAATGLVNADTLCWQPQRC